MSLDNNYSTINKQQKIISIDDSNYGTSRIIVNIKNFDYNENIVIGDVIRYDALNMQYVKSIANTPQDSEVFGIVESINPDQSLNVVVNGSITIDSSRLINVIGANTGNNDIYFLSGTSAGYLQNCGPTFNGYVIKPIYQKGPHGQFTGLVRNYIGYKKPDQPPPYAERLVAVSDDGSKGLYYITPSNIFKFVSFTYSTNIQSTFLNYISSPLALNQNTKDIKISNDGNHILIFDKTLKNIYYLHLNNSILELKAQIPLDISGISENLIWAADDELTSFTISTRALSRLAETYDFRITSHDSCSRILYFKRNVNSNIPYYWRQIGEQHAFGHCDYGPLEVSQTPGYVDGGLTDDDLELSSGVHRTCDLYCKNKNYALSTFCLGSDQIDYKTKTTGYYTKYQFLQFDPLKYIDNYYRFATRFDSSELLTTQTSTRSPFFKDFAPNQNYDNNINRFFKCNFGIKSFRIHKKINNYYYEDFSHAQNTGIEFQRPFLQSINLVTNSSITPELAILSELSSKTVSQLSFTYPPTGIVPTFSQDALWSSTSCTENILVFAFLYRYKNTSNNLEKKNLVVIKLPFDSYDGKNVFRYFMESSFYSGIVPSMTGFGLISNFLTTASTPVSNEYFIASLSQTPSGSIESPNLINQTTLTTPNIDQLTTFKIFTSDNRYFLCTDNNVIVWTYSSGTYVVRNINLKNSNFYIISGVEYFLSNEIMYFYNTSTEQFEQKTIG